MFFLSERPQSSSCAVHSVFSIFDTGLLQSIAFQMVKECNELIRTIAFPKDVSVWKHGSSREKIFRS